MGKHHKNPNEADRQSGVGSDYNKTGGGAHRDDKADKNWQGGHVGSRSDSDGKSSATGWGGDRSTRA